MTYPAYPLEGTPVYFVLDANGVVLGLRGPNTRDSNGADVPGVLVALGQNQFLAPDGTVTAPSYSYASQTDVGFFRATTQRIGVTQGGSSKVSLGVPNNSAGFGGVQLESSGGLTWSSTGTSDGASNLELMRDAADTLAQRRGVNAQTFRLYNTFTDASNYERFATSWSGNVCTVGPQAAGTGTQRSAVYLSSAPLAQGSASYTVAAGDNTIINSVAATLTLPAVATNKARKLRVVTTGANAIISNASNVVPITGGAAGTAILAATAGKWADLECDGSNWIITASN